MNRWHDFDLSEEEGEDQANHPIQRKQLRDMSGDPFLLCETEFRKMFRLSRAAARSLLDEITDGNPALVNGRWSHGIPFHLRFLATLHFLGQGSYQKPTGDHHLFCQSQPSISRSINLVLKELLKLTAKYVCFPQTPMEVSSAKQQFMANFRMPGIVCAVDGTHISIIRPPDSEDGYIYYNRKHYYSLNVLAACDANMAFVYADAQYPGSVHDSAIWQMSKLKRLVNDDGSTFLLGDSGFPSTRCMLTPVRNPEEGSAEQRYNVAHIRARNVIERAFGVLKTRFRCLSKHRVLHYDPSTAGKMVYACMVLHNICILQRIPNPEEDGMDEPEEIEEDDITIGLVQQNNADARRIRTRYINRNY